ncbi:MAG: flagellar biosynthesis protein FlhB [Gemmatimonadales bacterium]
MADEQNSAQERTESPTPRKRQRAREEGKIPRSAELLTAAVLLAGTGAVAVAAGGTLAGFAARSLRQSARTLSAGPLTPASVVSMLRDLGLGLLLALLPLLVGITAIVVLVGLIQTRGLVTGQPLRPQLSRLSPLANLKRIFGLEAVAALLKSTAKVLILGLVTWMVLARAWPEILTLAETGPEATLMMVRSLVLRLAMITGLAFLALAAFDYGFQVFQTEKSLKMTRQEVVQEHRESEGDPLIKSRIQSLARSRARQRMLQQVPRADVVIVNPTHVAVALQYDVSVAAAPVVLAMGERKLAERIKRIAFDHDVPVVENVAVARALLATATVGRSIPPALYAAVAEILAFVYRRRAGLPSAGSVETRRPS